MSFTLNTDFDAENPVETEKAKKSSMKVLMSQKGTRDHLKLLHFDGDYSEVANTIIGDFSELEKLMTNVKSGEWPEGSVKKLVRKPTKPYCIVESMDNRRIMQE